MDDDPQEGGHEFAQEADASDQVLAGPGDALAHIDEEIDRAGMPRLRIALELAESRLFQEGRPLRRRTGEIRLALGRQLVPGPVEGPGAEGVEPPDLAQIEDHGISLDLRGDRLGNGLDPFGMGRRPGTRQPDRRLPLRSLDCRLRLLSQGALRHDHPFGIDSVW